jgi:cytochrome c oxidase subunit 3
VASDIAARRQALPSGVWGMALFLCAETTLFAGLITSYFYLNYRATAWPPHGTPLPKVFDPSLLTGVLVASTVPVALASWAARGGNLRATIQLIAAASFVQCGYLAYQLHQYVGEVHALKPSTGAYASALAALVGFHHAHVLLGVLFNLVLLFWLVVGGLSDYRVNGIRAVALYWYVVNAIAVAVLLTEISPSL